MENSGENTEPRYAGFPMRLGAAIVDGMAILFAYVAFFTLFWLIAYPNMSSQQFLLTCLDTLLPVVYILVYFYQYITSGSGKSPGKRLFGLEVVDLQHGPISKKRAALRSLFFLVDTTILGLGHLFFLFNRKKQTLHDRLAGTCVVRSKAAKNPSQIAIVMMCALAVFFLSRSYLGLYVQLFSIPTTSMEPTVLMGDHVLIDKYWPNQNEPEQGDVVVFKYPQNKSTLLLKRCIATAGQVVEMRNDNCYIDGKAEGRYELLDQTIDEFTAEPIRHVRVITESGPGYTLRFFVSPLREREPLGPITVPEGYCFVLGDFRDNSADSRHWGFVPYENIIGLAGVVYYSSDSRNQRWDIRPKYRWERFGKVIM